MDPPDDSENIVFHIVSATDMQVTGLRLAGYSWRKIKKAKSWTNYGRFKSQFGISAGTARVVCGDLQRTSNDSARTLGSPMQLKYFFIKLEHII